MSRTNTLRRDVFIPPNDFYGFTGFYNSETRIFDSRTTSLSGVGSNRFAYSGNGQRVYMGDASGDKIYGADLALLGY